MVSNIGLTNISKFKKYVFNIHLHFHYVLKIIYLIVSQISQNWPWNQILDGQKYHSFDEEKLKMKAYNISWSFSSIQNKVFCRDWNDVFGWDDNYAGSNFWSSKVCEEGESRGANACRLTFDPTQFFSEINDHVTQTHFWSVFKLIENSILIQFEVM